MNENKITINVAEYIELIAKAKGFDVIMELSKEDGTIFMTSNDVRTMKSMVRWLDKEDNK